jgi:hypothetical protein
MVEVYVSKSQVLSLSLIELHWLRVARARIRTRCYGVLLPIYLPSMIVLLQEVLDKNDIKFDWVDNCRYLGYFFFGKWQTVSLLI